MGDDAELARLATLVAHELRTPLSVVSGYIKMLASERQGPLTEAQRRSVAGAQRACQQLIALASDLSWLARIERGEVSPSVGPVAIDSLLADIAASHTPIDEHPVRVEAAPANLGTTANPVTIEADAANLRRVLTSLLAAVIRAAPDDATVQILARRREAHGSRAATPPATPAATASPAAAAPPTAVDPPTVSAEPIAGVPRSAAAASSAGAAVPPSRSMVIALAPASLIEELFAADLGTFEALDESLGGLGVGLPLARRLIALDGGAIHTRSMPPRGLGILVTLPG